jgi:hypothetical protein
MFNRNRNRKPLLVFAAVLGCIFLLGPSLLAAPTPGTANAWARFARKHHCFLAVEGAYEGKHGGYVGEPPALPHGVRTISALVRWLRSKLPTSTVWRDKLDNRVIHVVYTKALRWKANPLNQRLTFHGTMSLKQVVTRILTKRFPRIGVECLGDQRSGLFPYFPGSRLRAYGDPLRFDVKAMTFRRFLTTGLVYNLGGPRPPVVLWGAVYCCTTASLLAALRSRFMACRSGRPPRPPRPHRRTAARHAVVNSPGVEIPATIGTPHPTFNGAVAPKNASLHAGAAPAFWGVAIAGGAGDGKDGLSKGAFVWHQSGG